MSDVLNAGSVMATGSNVLDKTIDFSVLAHVNMANPNGDPLSGNRPRNDFLDGHGVTTGERNRRWIRNRMQDLGCTILHQNPHRPMYDGQMSLKSRVEVAHPELMKLLKNKDKSDFIRACCETFTDVRFFGNAFTYWKNENPSVPCTVSVGEMRSISPIRVVNRKITKMVNGQNDSGKGKDTMGNSYKVFSGLYRMNGRISTQRAERSGFSWNDADMLKEILCTLFEEDMSAARPSGSMEVCRVYWWEHDTKNPKVTDFKVYRSLHVEPLVKDPCYFEDYQIQVDDIPGVKLEVIDLM